MTHQPDLYTKLIGTCHSCHRQPCWKPRQPKINPAEGCAEWLDGNFDTDDILTKAETDMPKLSIKRQKRLDGLLNTSVDECKNALQFETDIKLLEHLLRRSHDLGHTTREKYTAQRIRQLHKEKS